MWKSYEPKMEKAPQDISDVLGVEFETGVGTAKTLEPCKMRPEKDVIVQCGDFVWTMSVNKLRRMIKRGQARRP